METPDEFRTQRRHGKRESTVDEQDKSNTTMDTEQMPVVEFPPLNVTQVKVTHVYCFVVYDNVPIRIDIRSTRIQPMDFVR
jgi:hypothetical protein